MDLERGVSDDGVLPEHVRRNRVRWNAEAPSYAAGGERAWAREEPTWGIWRVPESELGVLPKDLAGKAGIELGCGTAYVSAWLPRRGVKVVGIHPPPPPLPTPPPPRPRPPAPPPPGVPADRGRRRARALPRRVLRSGDLRVRRLPLGGSRSLGRRGGPHPAARRRAHLPRELRAVRALRPGRGRRRRRAAPASGLRDATNRVARRSGGRVSPVARRLDSRPATQRIRGRRADRGAAAGDGDDELRVRHARVGAALAVRRGLARPAPVKVGEERWTIS